MNFFLEQSLEYASQPNYLWDLKEAVESCDSNFHRFIKDEEMGIDKMDIFDFTTSQHDAILICTDKDRSDFAREKLGYSFNRCPDFIARMHGKYVLGMAELLTNDEIEDTERFEKAFDFLKSDVCVEKLVILDGVLSKPLEEKSYNDFINRYGEYNIMSALLLKDFLYTIF